MAENSLYTADVPSTIVPLSSSYITICLSNLTVKRKIDHKRSLITRRGGGRATERGGGVCPHAKVGGGGSRAYTVFRPYQCETLKF